MRFDISALLNPKARPLLGLDISSSAVKLVELTANGKEGYRVERYAIEVLPKDAVSDGNIANMDGVVDAVRRAWKRLGTSTRHVAMALPGSAVITKKILNPSLVAVLQARAGRVIFNGFPTGVEVCSSMVHGGPFPATSDGRSTSVGTMAIFRFCRPVAWQSFPDAALPAELQEANPLGIRRLEA